MSIGFCPSKDICPKRDYGGRFSFPTKKAKPPKNLFSSPLNACLAANLSEYRIKAPRHTWSAPKPVCKGWHRADYLKILKFPLVILRYAVLQKFCAKFREMQYVRTSILRKTWHAWRKPHTFAKWQMCAFWNLMRRHCVAYELFIQAVTHIGTTAPLFLVLEKFLLCNQIISGYGTISKYYMRRTAAKLWSCARCHKYFYIIP